MTKKYIELEAAIAMFEQAFDNNWEVFGTLDRLRAIPAADVVEVVRCRECKHHDGIRCFRWNSVIVTMFDDYCSNGERKDGGQDDV